LPRPAVDEQRVQTGLRLPDGRSRPRRRGVGALPSDVLKRRYAELWLGIPICSTSGECDHRNEFSADSSLHAVSESGGISMTNYSTSSISVSHAGLKMLR